MANRIDIQVRLTPVGLVNMMNMYGIAKDINP